MKKITCHYRTKVAYKSRIQQLPKRQSSDLSFYKLVLSSQEQKELNSPSSSQDLIEKIKEFEEVLNTLVLVENEYIFQPRVRNLALNRFISFNIDYENIAVKELDLNLAVEEVGLNLAENDKTLEVYTKNDNFSKTSTESNKIFDNNDNIFEDYSAPNFEIPQKPNNVLNDNQFI
ncbi:hypothetical protein F8M41_021232 [Gigaspora margarita]|uniref:Uncharacterized protein n=1 Tax=Gigaspora margarita TaxID=4874 RepID=A0A8H4AH56_GIGMA|nr:hypothetical protein F8M41_021232 [Gigaspora margarita]